MTQYTTIIQRLREATGPDAGLDILLENALGLAKFQRDPKIGYGDADYLRVTARSLTSSVDAAFALVEEKLPHHGYWHGKLAQDSMVGAQVIPPGKDPAEVPTVTAPTAPLAILIALFDALKKTSPEMCAESTTAISTR